MADKENKKIEEKKLDDVNGGGLFSAYSEEDYNQAGVEVVGWGYFYNDGYKFQGQEISKMDASGLVFFTHYNERPAYTVEEAYEFYDYMSTVLDWRLPAY